MSRSDELLSRLIDERTHGSTSELPGLDAYALRIVMVGGEAAATTLRLLTTRFGSSAVIRVGDHTKLYVVDASRVRRRRTTSSSGMAAIWVATAKSATLVSDRLNRAPIAALPANQAIP